MMNIFWGLNNMIKLHMFTGVWNCLVTKLMWLDGRNPNVIQMTSESNGDINNSEILII